MNIEESLYKYTAEGCRIHLVFLNEAVNKMIAAHGLTEKDKPILGQAAALAECLCANRKEDNASVAVTVQYPEMNRQCIAIAEKDGRVRGRCDEYEAGVVKTGVLLEVSQKLTVRGDYSSIVTGKDIEDAVGEYYRVSQQTEAHCAVLTYGDTFACLLTEQFPITCEAEEKYRGSADMEWNYLRPFITANTVTEYTMSLFDKYRKVQSTPLHFGCSCTRRSVKNAIASIDKSELRSVADEDGFISVNCKYCGKHYRICIDD